MDRQPGVKCDERKGLGCAGADCAKSNRDGWEGIDSRLATHPFGQPALFPSAYRGAHPDVLIHTPAG